MFTPTLGPPATGLDMFAAASLPSPSGPGAAAPSLASLAQPGPFNPAASLSTMVTKKILDLEFVEMAEVSVDATAEQVLGRSPGRPPVVDISQWVERFSLMAAVIATRFPHKAPELFAYQATIVRAERNCEAGRWVAYDRQFRREALSRKDDPRLYSEAFTGRAKSIPRCTYCLQDDHPTQRCPQNPDQPWTAWFSGNAPLQGPPGMQNTRPSSRPVEFCRRYNEGRCRFASCRYVHSCRVCGGSHPSLSCRQGYQRPRSPPRSPAPQTRGAWPPARH